MGHGLTMFYNGGNIEVCYYEVYKEIYIHRLNIAKQNLID